MRRRTLLAAAPLILLAQCLMFADLPGTWPCKTNADCEAGERCRLEPNGQRSACVGALVCQVTQDCDPGLACENGTCVTPRTCGPCGARQYCNALGECEDACGAAECGTLHEVSCGVCPNGQSCDPAGKCGTQVCTANSTYCTGMSRIQCAPDGWSESELEVCGANECCVPTKCAARFCTPGQMFCTAAGEYSSCAADGCGLLPGTDCSVLAASCDAALGCVNMDVLGFGGTAVQNPCHENGSARQATGVIIQATRSARLRKFQQTFQINSKPASMRWMVYEASSLTGQYNQIYSQTTTEPPTQAKVQIASPTMDVQFTSGKYYLIGSECVDPWECWTFANDTAAASKDPTFGTVNYNVYFTCESLGSSFAFSQVTPYSEVLDFLVWSTP